MPPCIVVSVRLALPNLEMHTKATQLDQMLYAWLAETDDRKFDQAFQRYYEGASPSLVRYLMRCSSLADLDCEQIAVDALLKFFCRAGRDRRQAAAAVSTALPQIQPLNLGPFHLRQVRRWTGDVESFRHMSMTFRLTPQGDGAERPWKAEIQAQIDGIAPLQRQGLHLLESVRVACAAVADFAEGAPENFETDGTSEARTEEYAAIRAFAVRLREAAEQGAVGISALESRLPGVVLCVGGAWTVVDLLPALRIPTNGYLFDIAHSLYLDECKARGRKKRGGSGASRGEPDGETADHILAPFDLDEECPLNDEYADASSSTSAGLGGRSGELAADPTAELIDEDFCERFYVYLSKPLDDAQEAYRRAASAGKAEAERKRLASISDKHARFMSVLSMRIEGRTQEAIAESLSLSRNQVKYITEQAQAAYQQFCAAAMRSCRS
jgi:DNA-directed RNA polymerase specialized sigma24 family protein